MSALREQAVRMMDDLSEEDMELLIEWLRNKVSSKRAEALHSVAKNIQENAYEERFRAFERLSGAWMQIQTYLPDDFDPDAELQATLNV